MHCSHRLSENLYWIGGDDRQLRFFEGHHPVPHGMAYNNYLLLDEKTVLFDTIDRAVEERFLETLEHLLQGRSLDYLVVQHMEPDHSATLGLVTHLHPHAKILCTATCKQLISQFFGDDLAQRAIVVGDGDTFSAGAHTLRFLTAPMVHWPEVMVTYDETDRTLFSADAFGSFGALGGRLFDGEYDFEKKLLDENRRYYTNIIGKYGTQVTELLDKAATVPIDLICPLHGPVIRDNITRLTSLYRTWSAYEPEAAGVVIAYASIYGGTRDAAEKLAFKISDRGVHDIALFDVATTDPSYVLAEAFRVNTVVLASVTYNAGLFPGMAAVVDCLTEHNLRRRAFALIQNGSWGPVSGKLMRERLARIPETTFVGDLLTIRSRMKPEQDAELDALADAVVEACGKWEREGGDDAHAEAATGNAQSAAFAERRSTAASAAAAPAGGSAPVSADANCPSPTANAAVDSSAERAHAPLKPPRAASKLPAVPRDNMKVMQIWRCTFCGYQAEVPKGTDMSKFTCPVCFRSGEGQFIFIREKLVPR